jgi:hypothetical protein
VLFPEYLYQLSARDQQVTWLDPLITVVTQSTAGTAVTATYTVPNDRALILQAAVLVILAGAAQTSNEAYLGASRLATGAIFRFANSVYAAALQPDPLEFSGSLVIPAQWNVTGTAGFNAGVAANIVSLNIFGILIPIANIQRI